MLQQVDLLDGLLSHVDGTSFENEGENVLGLFVNLLNNSIFTF